MNKSFFAILIAVLPGLMVLSSESTWADNLNVNVTGPGAHYQFSSTVATVELSNRGDKPLAIKQISALRKNDRIISAVPTNIPAHASVILKVHIDLGDDIGHSRHVVRIITGENENNEYLAQIPVFGESVLDDVTPLIDFGVVDAFAKKPTRSITLTSREDPTFRLLSVKSQPDFVSAHIAPDGKTLNVTLRDDAAWGRHRAPIALTVDSSLQNEVWVEVIADVHGAVVPDANPLNLGLLRQGQINRLLLRFTDRTGNTLDIKSPKLEGIKGDVTVKPCVPAVDSCKLLSLNIASDQQTGKLIGRILVTLPAYGDRVLSTDTWGMLVKKDTKVVSLDEKDIQRKYESAATNSAKSVDLRTALKKATTPIAGEELNAAKMTADTDRQVVPPGDGPLLHWTVAHEASIFGYQIYRADSKDGPFALANLEIIKSKNVPDGETSRYQWRDTSAIKGNAYWYYVGVIKQDGSKQQLSGPQKVIAK